MDEHIVVRGSGVAGLTTALELTRRGFRVTIVEPHPDFSKAASWLAGGMLAPWCERESAEQEVVHLGATSAIWWNEAVPGEVSFNGTLVVCPPRDLSELSRFASRTSDYDWLDGAGVSALEPDLEGRFSKALFFEREAHLDPRKALPALRQRLEREGATFVVSEDAPKADFEVDCRGINARLPKTRGVRGEMLILECADVSLSRPVRMLHPRIPIYIVPRDDNRFMVGATMIESEDDGPITARSMMELVNAAYALHPAFAEARIVETGVGVRPAYADNLPQVQVDGDVVTVNGFYRHGFLLSPAMAIRAADMVSARVSGV